MICKGWCVIKHSGICAAAYGFGHINIFSAFVFKIRNSGSISCRKTQTSRLLFAFHINKKSHDCKWIHVRSLLMYLFAAGSPDAGLEGWMQVFIYGFPPLYIFFFLWWSFLDQPKMRVTITVVMPVHQITHLTIVSPFGFTVINQQCTYWTDGCSM